MCSSDLRGGQKKEQTENYCSEVKDTFGTSLADVAVYPEDGHQPYVTLGDPAPIKKVVVRIRTDMLAGGRAS